MAAPNFFQLANSELSQDAFIRYLLEWANPKQEYIKIDSALHSTGVAFVSLLLGSSYQAPIASVICKSQEKNIDVLALITDARGKQYAVIIEDKTDTCAHDNQLVRYSKYVKKKYKDWELHCVYLKTGNESKYSLKKMESDYLNDEWVKKNNPIFKIVLREDLIDILKKNCFSRNRIAIDFQENLERIQKLTDTYIRQDKVVGAWGNTAWQGFLMGIETKMGKGSWNHSVYPIKQNTKGRDLFGWEFKMPKVSVVEDNSVRVYLSLTLADLTLKVSYKSVSPKLVLTDVVQLNCMLSEYDLKLVVPKGKRNYFAAITRLDGTSFIDENNSVDIDCVVDKLNQLQNVLPELVKHIVMK